MTLTFLPQNLKH